MPNEFKIKNGLILDGVQSSAQLHVLTYNTSSGLVYYTSSAGTTPTFPFSGSAVITGSLLVSGSGITVTGSLNAPNITGSLQGTASYVTGSVFTSANPALSASYALTASFALNVSQQPINDVQFFTLFVA